MAYTVPTFNLTANWNALGAGHPPRMSSVCNLAYGKRTGAWGIDPSLGSIACHYMQLLLPARTDINYAGSASGHADFVEVPTGSGCWYLTQDVNDVGRGFPNEFRVAVIFRQQWPSPIP
jgi:hypothetical protein